MRKPSVCPGLAVYRLLTMNLSPELFQSVVQALRAEEANRADPNFSTLCARRISLGGRALIIPCTGDSAGILVEALARDISPSGIALTLPLRLVHGDQFILHLPQVCGCIVGPNAESSILCTVARYQYAGKALYMLGAMFTRVLGNAKATRRSGLIRLVGDPVPPPS
jgi:hypothetical protein